MKTMDYIINWLLMVRIRILIFAGYRFNKAPRNLSATSELSFLDDFNRRELNRDHWRTDNYFGFPIHPENIVKHNKAPDVIYTDTNHIMSDGKIYMYTKRENINYHYVDWDGKDWGKWTIPYSSGQIQQKKFEQLYGYFESSIAIANTPGTWPAFWLCSRHSWPPEIDIFEFYTGKKLNYFESNVHFNFQPNKKMLVSPGYVFNGSDNLNVWAVDWQKDYMKFYWNNILIRVIRDKEVLKWFNVPMFVIINNGIDTGAGRRLNEMESPNFMHVDWVRVWKKKD